MIATAIQRGDWVHVYDENGKQIFYEPGKLYGYTSTTVSIVRSGWVNVYNEEGKRIDYYSI